MKYDTFLFTRDDADYGWRKKPDYLPGDLYKKCKSIINLREKFPQWTEENWKKVIFALCVDGYPVLCRIIATEAEDPFGRPIFSFEGLTLKKITKRHMLDIVNVIQYFDELKCSFRDLYVEDCLENQVFIQEKMNPLDVSCDYEKEEETKMTAMEKMILDSGNFDLEYSFLYGENVGRIFPYVAEEYGLKKWYDLSESYLIKRTDMDLGYEIQPVQMEFQHKRSVEIKFCLQEMKRNTFSYCWVLEENEKEPLVVTKTKKVKNGLDVGILLEEEQRLQEYLKLIGMG